MLYDRKLRLQNCTDYKIDSAYDSTLVIYDRGTFIRLSTICSIMNYKTGAIS